MRRGTTPTLTCKIDGADLTDCHTFVTIRQGGYELDIENPDVVATETGCTITISCQRKVSKIGTAGTV